MTHFQEIHAQLEQAAYRVTDNFCYSCYKVVEGDRCPGCGSDDFMRILSERYLSKVRRGYVGSNNPVDARGRTVAVGHVGVEYGTDWVISHLIETRCTPVDGDELFEELLDECWPEVTIGYGTYSPSQILKACDPIAFEIGAKENLDNLAEDGVLFEHSGDYYRVEDIDQMLSDLAE